MGNSVCRRPASSSPSTTALDDENGAPNVHDECFKKDQQEMNFPNVPQRRYGAAGLCDLGFEFRLVPCCPQHMRNNDASSSPVPTSTSTTPCFECRTRLFHLESDTMITPDNRKEYIPDGYVFDDVSDCSQEVVQERLERDHAMKFVTICNDSSLGEPVRALVNKNFNLDDDESQQQQQQQSPVVPVPPTLLIITGKGKSRAGIMSVKQVIESGMEVGSALFHMHQARKRNGATNIILLDPNARGVPNGMDTVDRSLTYFFSHNNDNKRGPLYVLAHSAAGGYLVRYFVAGPARCKILNNVCAIVFTDSTHRIQWARNDARVFALLESSSRCLYIRNNTLGNALSSFDNTSNHAKKAGEVAVVDVWWRQRFGQIPTVWAGTCDHSLVCWTARFVIWDFFDKNTTTQQPQVETS